MIALTTKSYIVRQPTKLNVFKQPADLETENTLRLLFTAQQQVQQAPTPPANQDEDMETDTPTPTVDCRQQTLLQFFRPSQPSRQPCSSTPISQFSSEVLQGGNVFPQGHGFGGASPPTSNYGDAMTLAPQPVDRDMDIDMDTGSNESSPAPRQWTGPVGWI